MHDLSNLDYENLLILLEKLIDKKIDEKLINMGVESASYGVVSDIRETKVDADGNITAVVRADVKLASGDIIRNMFNATGEILEAGDNIKIYGSETDKKNRYIGIKYEREVASYAEQTD